jgi:hypothetical protein
VAESAKFCQKCGAKLAADNMAAQSPDAPVQTIAARRAASSRKQDVSRYLLQQTEAVEHTPTMTQQFTEQATPQPQNDRPLFASRADETVLFKKGGGQIVGALGSSGGYIKLTDQRLICESLKGKVKAEININDIFSYRKDYNISLLTGLLLPLGPKNAFIIYTKQGVTYKFCVSNLKQLLQLFQQIIPMAKQMPDEKYGEARKSAWRGINPNDERASKQRKIIIAVYGILLLLALVAAIESTLSDLGSTADSVGTVNTRVNSDISGTEDYIPAAEMLSGDVTGKVGKTYATRWFEFTIRSIDAIH